jgi:hypothetical protein
MYILHPVFLVVIVVAFFVTMGIPRARPGILEALKVGGAFVAFAVVMNAVFQWNEPNPINLLLMNEKAGTFECVLLSIGYANLLRGIVGATSLMFKRHGRN